MTFLHIILIDRERDRLIERAKDIKGHTSVHGWPTDWAEPIKITEFKDNPHDRVHPYDGYSIDIRIKKGMEDWRIVFNSVGQVDAYYETGICPICKKTETERGNECEQCSPANSVK